MVANAFTGGSASVAYGYETDFADHTSNVPSFTDTFGLQQKVSSLSLNTSRIDLNKLGQVEPAKFAYGQQQGALSMGFVYDDIQSYKLLKSIYGEPTVATGIYTYPAAAGGSIYTGTSGTSVSPAKTPSLSTRIQVNAGTDNILTRTLKGCVVNSMGISTTIGETVNGTIDMAFAKEDTADIAATTSTFVQQDASAINQPSTPYTFAHGSLKLGTGASNAMTEVAEIQDVDVTFTTNNELLYGLGSHYAKTSFRKIFDIGGRFKTTFKDKYLLQHVIDQSRTENETINEDASNVALELMFTNGNRSMKFEFGGVSLNDHSTSGIEPAEVIYEELNWKAKYSFVTVDTTA